MLAFTSIAYGSKLDIKQVDNLNTTYNALQNNGAVTNAWILNINPKNTKIEIIDKKNFRLDNAFNFKQDRSKEYDEVTEQAIKDMGGYNSVAWNIDIPYNKEVKVPGLAYRVTFEKAGIDHNSKVFDIIMDVSNVTMKSYTTNNESKVQSKNFGVSVFSMGYGGADFNNKAVPYFNAGSMWNKKTADNKPQALVGMRNKCSQDVNVRFVYSDTKEPLKNPKVLYRFYDIDVDYNGGEYAEGVNLGKGFTGNIYVVPNNYLKIYELKNGDTRVQALHGTTTTFTIDPKSSFMAEAQGQSQQFTWTGNEQCSTAILINAKDLPSYPKVYGDLFGRKNDIEQK